MAVLMPSPVFRWFVPAQNGTGLVPAAGYKAKFYAAGTSDPKTIYTDAAGTPYPSPANEAELNSEGYAVIYLGIGGYKLIVTDPDDAEIFTLDDIVGGSSLSSGFVETVIASDDPPTNGLAQADSTANQFVWCAGYWEIGDGGHGFFWNETSADADDGGYVIASTFDATKRWFRVPDESGSVRAASFGYVGTRAEDLSDELLAAASYAQTNGLMLTIGRGDQATISTTPGEFYLYSPFVHFEAGSMLTGDASFAELHFIGVVSGTAEQHFTGFQAMFDSPEQGNASPEWFGANANASNNQPAFTAWLASGAQAYTLPAGAWNVANTASFAYPSVPLNLLGSITGTTGTTIPTGVYYPDDSRFHLHQIEFPNTATITEWSEGTGIDIVGSTNVDGFVEATEDVVAGQDMVSGGVVNAANDVNAGYAGAAGAVFSRAGTSTNVFAAGGLYYSVLGSVSTTGGNLMSTTITANSMSSGDRLRICLSGTTTSALSQVMTITVALGGITIASIPLTLLSGDWRMVIEAWWTTDGCYASSVLNATTLVSCDNISTGATISESADQTLQVSATSDISATVTQRTLSIEYYRRPD